MENQIQSFSLKHLSEFIRPFVTKIKFKNHKTHDVPKLWSFETSNPDSELLKAGFNP